MVIHVAVGVIKNSEDKFLVAERPVGKPLSGLWEFPGGKIHDNETILQALGRELKEEIGIIVISAKVHFETSYEYNHQIIKLHVCLVESYQGQPQGVEGQLIRWVTLAELKKLAVPPANEVIVEMLSKELAKT